jgi:hypothetical protein
MSRTCPETLPTRRSGVRLRAVAVLVSLAIVAGCGASIDPAAKADLDGRIAALRPSTSALPAPTTFMPMPLAAGQWTQHKMLDDKGQPSLLTYKILSEEAGAFWIETVHESYKGRTIQKMLVAFGNRTDPSQIEIRAISMKDQKGRVNEVPPPVLSMMQSLYKNAVSMLVVNWQGQPQESVLVPAGQFAACFRTRTDAQWAGYRTVSDSWTHSAVPISGLVRSQGVDKPYTMELVAYGLSGATSQF